MIEITKRTVKAEPAKKRKSEQSEQGCARVKRTSYLSNRASKEASEQG